MEIHTSFDLVLSSTVSHNPMKILLKNQVYYVQNDHILVVKDQNFQLKYQQRWDAHFLKNVQI